MNSLAAVAELVPNRLRGTVQACLDLLIFPWSVFGALTGKDDSLLFALLNLTSTGGAMVVYHGQFGFRINYMIGVALNTLSVLAIWFWYHPVSTFELEMK
jgi:hypothetical protein